MNIKVIQKDEHGGLPHGEELVRIENLHRQHKDSIRIPRRFFVCFLGFLAPLAEGQRAIVMAWGRRASVHPSVRASVRASVNFFFKKLLLRNY